MDQQHLDHWFQKRREGKENVQWTFLANDPACREANGKT